MEKGIVIKSTGSWYLVKRTNGEIIEARIRGKLRTKGLRTTNPVAVGDIVSLEKNEDNFVITEIGERRNYIIRKSTNLSKEAHIIASNVDQTLLIATINHPVTSAVFIDRILATTEAYNIPAILVFNKSDLYDNTDREKATELITIYSEIGYRCLQVSAVTGQNITELRELLKDKVTVLSGMSGVGKSTLINCIEPQLQLKTASISDSHDTGKHTTTFAEMFPLNEGGYIVDTPGVRSFGIIDMERKKFLIFPRNIPGFRTLPLLQLYPYSRTRLCCHRSRPKRKNQ